MSKTLREGLGEAGHTGALSWETGVGFSPATLMASHSTMGLVRDKASHPRLALEVISESALTDPHILGSSPVSSSFMLRTHVPDGLSWQVFETCLSIL